MANQLNVPALLIAAGDMTSEHWRFEMHPQYTCGIYKLSAPGGRCYIGSSCNVEKRLRDHWRDLTNKRHRNGRLQRAWNEAEHFDYEIVERCDQSALKDREQFWIDELQSYLPNWGFNIERIAQNKPQTEDTRRKIGDGNRGKRRTVQQRIELSEALKGHRRTPEARRKQSESIKGHVTSEDTRRKIAEAQKGVPRKPWSEERRRKWNEKKEETARKIGIANSGRHPSEETRRKLSEAGKAYRAKLRGGT